MAGWGNQPHFASVVADRVPKVSDETSSHSNTPHDQAIDDLASDDQASDDQAPDGQAPDGDPGDTRANDTRLDEARDALEHTRRRLAEAPAEVVITNHVMGLYELAAIHLGAQPPDLAQAALAIDAVGCLVEGLGERLGSEADTLAVALSNIRLAFVQIKGANAG